MMLMFTHSKKIEAHSREAQNYLKSFLILLLFIILPFSTHATHKEKPVVTTTIAPISSFVAMIAGDKVEISTIASSSGCPHHYFLKPSDLDKMENSDLFIYIDENFDVFAKALLSKFNKDSVKISSLQGIKIINNNFHLWLLPENGTVILQEITTRLTEILPEYQVYFQKNLEIHLKKMQTLSVKRMGLKNFNIVLLSDSAEYLFLGLDNVITEYQSEYSSVKSIKKLKNLAKEDKCFVISSSQDLSKYQKLLGNKVVSVYTENWEINSELEYLYYKEYENIINNIYSGCR